MSEHDDIDMHYVEWLERRCAELEQQLERAENIANEIERQRDNASTPTLHLVAQLESELYSSSHRHPSSRGEHDA